jgi:hypothetical protein
MQPTREGESATLEVWQRAELDATSLGGGASSSLDAHLGLSRVSQSSAESPSQMLQSPDRNGVPVSRVAGMQVDGENVMQSWHTRHKVSISQAGPELVSVCETASLLSQTMPASAGSQCLAYCNVLTQFQRADSHSAAGICGASQCDACGGAPRAWHGPSYCSSSVSITAQSHHAQPVTRDR